MFSRLLFWTLFAHLKLSLAQDEQDEYSGYSCVDRNKECRYWTAQKECDSNPKFMMPQCCGSCINACADTRSNCSEVAKQGYCNQYEWLMGCKMSCGMCCSDYNQGCAEWARKGECAANPRFMLVHCMKSCQACSSPCKNCTEGQYMEKSTIQGFNIRSERGVFYRWPNLTSALKEDLGKLNRVVPKKASRLLKYYSGIFISKLKLCGSYPTCAPPDVADAYHLSAAWLKTHHETPAKAGFVDLQNPGEYMVRRSGIETYNLLHEFSHAWFDIRRRAALVGDRASARKEEAVKMAYQNALNTGIYNRVPYAGGGYRPGYAKESVFEYMAELSEAYFARGRDKNDYYPYNRQQLMKHDPVGFRAIQGVWRAPYPTEIAPAGP